jgi:hypothetical protein
VTDGVSDFGKQITKAVDEAISAAIGRRSDAEQPQDGDDDKHRDQGAAEHVQGEQQFREHHPVIRSQRHHVIGLGAGSGCTGKSSHSIIETLRGTPSTHGERPHPRHRHAERQTGSIG